MAESSERRDAVVRDWGNIESALSEPDAPGPLHYKASDTPVVIEMNKWILAKIDLIETTRKTGQ